MGPAKAIVKEQALYAGWNGTPAGVLYVKHYAAAPFLPSSWRSGTGSDAAFPSSPSINSCVASVLSGCGIVPGEPRIPA